MSSPSQEESNIETEPSTSVTRSAEPTIIAEVTDSEEAAERATRATDKDEEDEVEEEDDDDEVEEEVEFDDEEEEDQDMPKWEGGMPRAPPIRPVAGIKNPHGPGSYPTSGGK